MEVRHSTKMGFCYGIKRAIEIAEKHPNAVCVGGEITRSPMEPERLKKDFGITSTLDYTEIDPEQTAIIIPHGIAKDIEKKLNDKNIKIIDTTCPSVKRIQLKIEELDKEGYTIVLLGNKNHPEIKGHIGYAKNEVIVVKNAGELPNNLPKKIAIISQTTENEEELLKIHEKLPHALLCNTICTATSQKNKACEDLARQVDIMIVVGGKASCNTRLLQDIASKYCETHLVEAVEDIDPAWFVNKKLCGLTAGATSPDYVINAVKNYIAGVAAGSGKSKQNLE